MGVEKALADSQTRGWLRGDEALGLSLDLGLRHFTRLKLLASLGVRRGAKLLRDGMRRDIYPRLADSEAGEWMAGSRNVEVGMMNDEVPDREQPLSVSPPEHRWEEMLRDVSSLAEKIRRRLGERALFRGMNFWFTQLHLASAWPVAATKG